jgi:hypothetical protein
LIEAARALQHALFSIEGAAAVDLGLLIFARRQDEEGVGFAFKKLTPEDRATLDNDPTLIADPARLFTTLETLKKQQAAQLDGEGASTEHMLH